MENNLLAELKTLPHAIIRWEIIEANGKISGHEEIHYLTCRRCSLLRIIKNCLDMHDMTDVQ